MPSFKLEISRHNKKIMKNDQEPPPNPGCNCRYNPCPLSTNNWQTIVYRATVTDENQNVNT